MADLQRHPRDKVLLVRYGQRTILRQGQGAPGRAGKAGRTGTPGKNFITQIMGQWNPNNPVNPEDIVSDPDNGCLYMWVCEGAPKTEKPHTDPSCWKDIGWCAPTPKLVVVGDPTEVGGYKGEWSATWSQDNQIAATPPATGMVDRPYYLYEMVTQNGSLYSCRVTHVSSADKEPGLNADASGNTTEWALMFSASLTALTPAQGSITFYGPGTAVLVAAKPLRIVGRTKVHKADGNIPSPELVPNFKLNNSSSTPDPEDAEISMDEGDTLAIILPGTANATTWYGLSLEFAA